MSSASTELDLRRTPLEACRLLRGSAGGCILLDGGGGMPHGWKHGSLLAVRTGGWRQFTTSQRSAGLRALEDVVQRRRLDPGTADTGVLAILSYDLGAPSTRRRTVGTPGLAMVEVDAAVRFPPAGSARLTVRAPHLPRDEADRLAAALRGVAGEDLPARATSARRARTSLPRADYLGRVERIREHIRAGDIYQANLTQSFTLDGFAGDAMRTYARLMDRTPAPRSALVEGPDWWLLSASPETFLSVDGDGRVETRPIKGTRPRHPEPVRDRQAAAELAASEKDRAELTMITDLERNDLGRVCLPGSVRVPMLVGLESFPEVHHLVSSVVGRLRPEVGAAALFEATFPGGSITGAPKIRATEILRELEPIDRGLYTGSLAWFGDDGSMESSILIRSIVLHGGRAQVGAGGGIVADSDPEAEWRESNHKARALAAVLGFDPEEAV